MAAWTARTAPGGMELPLRSRTAPASAERPARAWSCAVKATVQTVPPFYFASALNTGFGVDATRALLTFARRTDAALELERGALS